MIQDSQKAVLVSGAVTLNSGGTAAITSAAVDTQPDGVVYGKATFYLFTGTVATGGELSVYKIQSSTASAGSYADVTGATAGANPLDEDDDDAIAVIEVDLVRNSAERYLKVVASSDEAANCPIVAVVCVLSNGSIVPVDSSAYASYTSI